MHRIIGFIITAVLAIFCASTGHVWAECGQVYVFKPKVNMRGGPGSDHSVTASLKQNTSLDCLEIRDEWARVANPIGQVGWVRSDLLSAIVIRIHKNERQLLVTVGNETVLTLSVTPGKKGLGAGRYFAHAEAGKLILSWPSLHDLRSFLLAGKMSYSSYQKAILKGSHPVGESLAICSSKAAGSSCGAVLLPGDFTRLVAEIPQGVRVEIYASNDEDRDLNRLDEFSRRIFLGAQAQLKYSAAGLSPTNRVPVIPYPGGDIQPDFAASSDIVIRSVRHAGVDLQALVHEDILLNPGAYSGLKLGDDSSGFHRLVPVLVTYLKRHALSLSTDVQDDLFSFEPGDIVAFASGGAGNAQPDHVGIVDETYNGAGYPLVITVWDMGQSTSSIDLLGREDPKVVGHFRMSHIFDYQ